MAGKMLLGGSIPGFSSDGIAYTLHFFASHYNVPTYGVWWCCVHTGLPLPLPHCSAPNTSAAWAGECQFGRTAPRGLREALRLGVGHHPQSLGCSTLLMSLVSGVGLRWPKPSHLKTLHTVYTTLCTLFAPEIFKVGDPGRVWAEWVARQGRGFPLVSVQRPDKNFGPQIDLPTWVSPWNGAPSTTNRAASSASRPWRASAPWW